MGAASFLMSLTQSPHMRPAMRCAGLVFLAFAFNMVDCGGILGGRLGKDMNIHAASLKKSKVGPGCLAGTKR